MARLDTLRPHLAWGLLALILACVPAYSAAADSSMTSPLLERLVARAWDQAPTLQALRARVSAAHERTTAADAWPDPSLEIAAQEVGVTHFDTNSYLLLEIRQELPYPGKTAARKRTAEAESAVRTAEWEDLRRRVRQQIKAAYAQLYALDAERRALLASKERFALLSATLSARYATGQADQEALLKSQLESSRLDERLLDLAAERSAWLASLHRLLDSSDDAIPEDVTELPEPPSPPVAITELALANDAEIAAKQALLQWSDRRLQESRLDQRPDFMFGFGAGTDGMPQPMVMLRFGVQLPVWSGSKQEPLTRSAGFESEAARRDWRDAQAQTRAEAQRLAAQWQRDTQVIAHYRDTILPQTRALLEAARTAYLAGKGGFEPLLDDSNRVSEAQTQLARREADRFRTYAEIERLTLPTGAHADKGERHDTPHE